MKEYKYITDIISKGDTGPAEKLFNKPGGKKYLECIVLTVIGTLSFSDEEKEDIFKEFIKGLDKVEKRIKRQKEGQKILRDVFS